MNNSRRLMLVITLLLAALLVVTAGCGGNSATEGQQESAAAGGNEVPEAPSASSEQLLAQAATSTRTQPSRPADTPTKAPTNTPTPTSTMLPTGTPTPSPSPTQTSLPTDTPVPDAVVVAPILSLRLGPGTEYYEEPVLRQGDELMIWAQYDDCAWLMLTDPPGAWVSGDSDDVELRTECANFPPPPPGSFRPFSELVARSVSGGMGELLIKNGTDSDALAVLTTLDDQAVLSAYIRTGEQFQMTGIPDDAYRLYFHMGTLWDSVNKQFMDDASYQRFEDFLQFQTMATQYTGFEVTLYEVVGGTAATEDVDPGQFPRP